MRPRPADDFQALYARHGPRVYRFCLRLCGSASDAEDLTQDVFLAAFLGQARFEGRSSALTWLTKIALNCRRHSVRTPRPVMVSAPESVAEDAAQAGPGLEQSVTESVALSCALSALPPDLHEAFLLVKAEGLTYREAAQVLAVPQGTVQWRVHAASRRLRALLTEDEERTQ